jgi:hypothetical protein
MCMPYEHISKTFMTTHTCKTGDTSPSYMLILASVCSFNFFETFIYIHIIIFALLCIYFYVSVSFLCVIFYGMFLFLIHIYTFKTIYCIASYPVVSKEIMQTDKREITRVTMNVHEFVW